MPEYVKSAQARDLCAETLTDEDFADRKRRLPCHSKAATALSYMQLQSSPEEFEDLKPEELKKLAKAITLFDVRKDVEKAPEVVKEASAPRYAFEGTVNGQTIRKLPINNDREAEMAAHYLLKHANSFTAQQKFDMANNIEGVLPSESPIRAKIEKLAGSGRIVGSDLAFLLRRVGTQPCEKVAAKCESIPFVESGELKRVIRMIVKEAEQVKWSRIEYGMDITPESEVAQIKDASVKLANGMHYRCQDILKLETRMVEDLIGESCRQKLFPIGVKSASLVKDAAAGLSEKEAEAITSALTSIGVEPTERPEAVRLSLTSLLSA